MIIFTADFHIHAPKRWHRLTEDGINDRLWDKVVAISQIVTFAQANRVSDIFVLGDVFESLGESLDKHSLLLAHRLFEKMSAYTNTIILPGNHDWYKNFWLTELLPCERHIIVPTVFPLFTKWEIGLIPWCANEEEFLKSLRSLEWTRSNRILLMHQGIEGAKADTTFIEEALKPSHFKGVDFVISGHYHKKQKVQNIIYCGSPIQHSYKEAGQDKGFLTFDGNKFKFEKIDSPQFNKILIGSEEGVQKFLKVYKDRDYYDITIASPEVDIDLLPKGSRIEIHPYIEHIVDTTVEQSSTTIEDLIVNTIEESDTDLNKEEWKEIALKMLKEVKE